VREGASHGIALSEGQNGFVRKGEDDEVNAQKNHQSDASFCEDASCSDTHYDILSQAEMDQYGSEIGALNTDGTSFNGVTAVNGKALACRDTMVGYNNCCKDSGWGNK